MLRRIFFMRLSATMILSRMFFIRRSLPKQEDLSRDITWIRTDHRLFRGGVSKQVALRRCRPGLRHHETQIARYLLHVSRNTARKDHKGRMRGDVVGSWLRAAPARRSALPGRRDGDRRLGRFPPEATGWWRWNRRSAHPRHWLYRPIVWWCILMRRSEGRTMAAGSLSLLICGSGSVR